MLSSISLFTTQTKHTNLSMNANQSRTAMILSVDRFYCIELSMVSVIISCVFFSNFIWTKNSIEVNARTVIHLPLNLSNDDFIVACLWLQRRKKMFQLIHLLLTWWTIQFDKINKWNGFNDKCNNNSKNIKNNNSNRWWRWENIHIYIRRVCVDELKWTGKKRHSNEIQMKRDERQNEKKPSAKWKHSSHFLGQVERTANQRKWALIVSVIVGLGCYCCRLLPGQKYVSTQ